MPRRRRPPRAGALTELPPLRILGQIAALQALYYATAFVLMLFTALVAGTHFTIDLVFGWNAVRGDTTQGWLIGFIWVLDGGLFMSAAIVLLVARSKLVLDFALSLHLIHLLAVSLYTHQLPRNIMWWLTMAAASAVAVGLATWGCRYRELKPISFGAGGAGVGTDTHTTEGQAAVETPGQGAAGDADEEHGLSRGRGRGRGKDGAGEYEMVKMNGHVSG